MGVIESATAKSKQEARAIAAEKVLSKLTEKEKPKAKEVIENIKKQKEMAQKKPHKKVKSNKRSSVFGKQTSPKKQSYQHRKHL
jgi:hypothetical protein